MKNLLLFLALALPLTLSAAPARITVSGHIHDSETGETLIGAGVVLDQAQVLTGAATNNYGYYSLTLSSATVGGRDRISLSYSYVGYETQVIEIPFVRDTVINVTLTPSLELEGSVVPTRTSYCLTACPSTTWTICSASSPSSSPRRSRR